MSIKDNNTKDETQNQTDIEKNTVEKETQKAPEISESNGQKSEETTNVSDKELNFRKLEQRAKELQKKLDAYEESEKLKKGEHQKLVEEKEQKLNELTKQIEETETKLFLSANKVQKKFLNLAMSVRENGESDDEFIKRLNTEYPEFFEQKQVKNESVSQATQDLRAERQKLVEKYKKEGVTLT